MEIAAVPLKSFGNAKTRMAEAFDSRSRESLGRAIAAHTIEVVADAVGAVCVVTSDDEVAGWAEARDAEVILERREGLNAAADRIIEAAAGERWMIVHADLPLLNPEDVQVAWNGIPEDGFLLAPSHDGGTSVFAGRVPSASFAYGAGSFHRHLARVRRHPLRIVARPGFLLDLDAPSDYAAASRHPLGSWLDSAVDR